MDYERLTDEGRRRRLKPLARAALRDYDLDPVRIRGLTDATNGVFRVDTSDGGRYVIRVGMGPPAGHTAASVASEAQLLAFLSSRTTIRVPRPIPRRDGDLVTVVGAPGVPGERPCTVFSWLPGPLLADRLDDPNLVAFGAVIAGLHDAATGFRAPADFVAPCFDTVYPYQSPFIVFSDAGTDLLPKRRRAVFEEALDLVNGRLAELVDGSPMRILHGDLHQWNAKVHRGRISVFDFEDMVWGWPVQDLATTLYYFWSDERFEAQWSAIRAGYETVAPWPDAGSDIAVFIAARSLLIANDVISQPEWVREAPAVYERGERRIVDMLRRIG